ncbi:hypothetical protein F4782DRAFT_483423 [Xylaria castorea]|nr:hypothetical protein F4782DRAFT_483423 [Xylaria castorea]
MYRLSIWVLTLTTLRYLISPSTNSNCSALSMNCSLGLPDFTLSISLSTRSAIIASYPIPMCTCLDRDTLSTWTRYRESDYKLHLLVL